MESSSPLAARSSRRRSRPPTCSPTTRGLKRRSSASPRRSASSATGARAPCTVARRGRGRPVASPRASRTTCAICSATGLRSPPPPRRSSSAPATTPTSDVLCQIRGVGRYIAMLVIAEVGDVSRFPSARHLCAWA
ncbi:MAG: hypothetical protein C5B48_07530, partial [Candidatus Rokuibacteriota bacterium]